MIFEIQWTLFENTVFVQTILVIFSLLLIIVIIGVSLYIYRKVLRPVMGFYNQIKNYSENFQYSVDESLVELDEAARMINRLYDEVHGLKEDNYIQRIKRQEAELSFVRLQIRPHFYINCLNVICSMAQLNKNEAIQDMCLNISDYMRLLFRKDTSLIQLSQELEMTDKYLRVIKNVYGQAFNYFLNVDCDSHAFLILPLLIQTFVENSIKYGGRDVEDVLEIWVNISLKENKENRMCIQIQDSGVGFGSDILGQLSQEHIESQDTTHQWIYEYYSKASITIWKLL